MTGLSTISLENESSYTAVQNLASNKVAMICHDRFSLILGKQQRLLQDPNKEPSERAFGIEYCTLSKFRTAHEVLQTVTKHFRLPLLPRNALRLFLNLDVYKIMD